jgi:hypothetical protein
MRRDRGVWDREDGNWAEALWNSLFIAIVVPMNEAATGFEALETAIESLMEPLAFGFAMDQKPVMILHLLASQLMAVVPDDGPVGLDGSGRSVRDPDDSGAGLECVDKLLNRVRAPGADGHFWIPRCRFQIPAGI